MLAMIGEEYYRLPEQLPGRCGICGAPAREDGFGVTVASRDHTGSLRLCASCIKTRTAADVLAEAIRLDQRRRAAWHAEREAKELARDPGQCRHWVACMVPGQFFDVPGARFCTRTARHEDRYCTQHHKMHEARLEQDAAELLAGWGARHAR
jgi:hypothetical protein